MSDLVERLRGIYNIPVNDGAGPLNGSMTFTRAFKTSPIMHEAADRIEQLESQLANARKADSELADRLEKLLERVEEASIDYANSGMSPSGELELMKAYKNLYVTVADNAPAIIAALRKP